MPDPSHRPYNPMTIIRPNSKPAFWWLFPWSYAQVLHRAANALRALCDRQDEIIRSYREEVRFICAENAALKQRIADQNDAIIRGTAITPDATPYRDDTIHE